MRLAVLLLRCAVGFDAFVAQIQGFDRRSNGPYLRDIAGRLRDLNEAFSLLAVDEDIVVPDGIELDTVVSFAYQYLCLSKQEVAKILNIKCLINYLQKFISMVYCQ